MKTYLVGGAVRDQLLNYPTKDRDWVVVGANVDKMLALGYLPVGSDFPVFLHPETKEEYALARTERKTGQGYQGFSFYASEDVSLEQDLSRRDLTINAIAKADDGTLIDPFNGQHDLAIKVLRHVSEAFSEDPLRVLRTARFAARYAHLGFTVAGDTTDLMRTISQSGELKHLSAERIWQEIERALLEQSPITFFNVLNSSQSLIELLPTFNHLMENLAELSDGKSINLQSKICSLNSSAQRFCWLNYIAQLNSPASQQTANTQELAYTLRCSKLCKYLIIQTTAIMQLLNDWQNSTAKDKLSFLQSAGVLRDNDKLKQLLEISISLHFDENTFAEFKERCHILNGYAEKIVKIDHKQLIAQGFSGAGLGKEINKVQLTICGES